MATLKEQLMKATQDPRVVSFLQDPRVQSGIMRALRLRGRVEGELSRRLDKAAAQLNLATQKDVRALNRRIRHLERELREALELLNGPESPEALDRS